MPKITPFLWFDGQAEEAAAFYTAIFPDSRIKTIARYGDAGPGPTGTAMTVVFELDGQEFVGLNGGPQYEFTEAVSFSIDCRTQQEIDHYWERLGAGGVPGRCGWLEDRFGLSWQVVPAVLAEMMSDPDPARAGAVARAMLRMRKLVVADLESAYRGGAR
jgi:predicted 3-demethylubiquinone-9 3-methyltransferase (glyoxalase superfamily)